MIRIATLVLAVVLAGGAATWASSGATERFIDRLRGQSPVEQYDALSDAPAGTGPSWLPGDTRAVSARTKAKAPRELAGATRIDGLVSADWSTPPDCRRTTFRRPWDGGGDWPLAIDTKISSCLDGEIEWNLFVKGARVYLFRDAIRP